MSILKRLFVQSLHQIGQTLKIYPSLGQTCPTPFDFWKVPFWTPKKVQFWFLKKTPLKIFFFMFLLWFSFKNKRRTNILLVGIFRRAQKKLLTVKMPLWPFLAVFCAFSKIPPKTAKMALLTVNNFIFVRFQKQRPKEYLCIYCFQSWIKAETQSKQFVGGVFFKNQKPTFWGFKMVLSKSQISNLFSRVCSLMWKEASCQF